MLIMYSDLLGAFDQVLLDHDNCEDRAFRGHNSGSNIQSVDFVCQCKGNLPAHIA